jgi:hypothetical protein
MKVTLQNNAVWLVMVNKFILNKNEDDAMSVSVFEEIHGFVSPGEYKRFLDYLKEQCDAKVIKEIFPEEERAKKRMHPCRWFKELDTGYTWRLLEPDPPFYGLWERVINNS